MPVNTTHFTAFQKCYQQTVL